MTAALICVGALTASGWAPIRERCRAPFDGAVYTVEAHGRVEALRLDLAEAVAARDEARADFTRTSAWCTGRLRAMGSELDACATGADECAAALDIAAERVVALERAEAERLPAWVWALAGAGAPLAAIGACALADCSEGVALGAAGGSVAVAAGVGLMWEW